MIGRTTDDRIQSSATRKSVQACSTWGFLANTTNFEPLKDDYVGIVVADTGDGDFHRLAPELFKILQNLGQIGIEDGVL